MSGGLLPGSLGTPKEAFLLGFASRKKCWVLRSPSKLSTQDCACGWKCSPPLSNPSYQVLHRCSVFPLEAEPLGSSPQPHRPQGNWTGRSPTFWLCVWILCPQPECKHLMPLTPAHMWPEKLLHALAFQIPTCTAEMSPGCKGSVRMLTPGEDPPLRGCQAERLACSCTRVYFIILMIRWGRGLLSSGSRTWKAEGSEKRKPWTEPLGKQTDRGRVF